MRLPARVEVVYDLFERKTIDQDTDTLQVRLPRRSTTLCYVGDTEQIRELANT